MPRLATGATPGRQLGSKSAKSFPSRDQEEQQLKSQSEPRPLETAPVPNPTQPSKPTPQRGALRGLNSNNLPTPATQTPIESSLEGKSNKHATPTPRHETRASRNGRSQVNYSMKYHPMDDVTRPKRASRILGFQPDSTSRRRHDDHMTSDESEGELALDDNTEQSDDDHDSRPVVHLQRIPDPKATRSSARSLKEVNYSKKRHPQDYGIDGFKHLARQDPAGGPRKRAAAVSRRPAKRAAIPISSDKDDSRSDDSDDKPVKRGLIRADQQPGVELTDDTSGTHAYVSIPHARDNDGVLSHDEVSSEVDAILRGGNIQETRARSGAPRSKDATDAGGCTGKGLTTAGDDESAQCVPKQPASLLLKHLMNASSKRSSSNTLPDEAASATTACPTLGYDTPPSGQGSLNVSGATALEDPNELQYPTIPSSTTLRQISNNTQISEGAFQSSHFEDEMAITESRIEDAATDHTENLVSEHQ